LLLLKNLLFTLIVPGAVAVYVPLLIARRLSFASCAGSALVYGLLVALGFHGFVVLYEEPHLRRKFGRQYEDYIAGVGRWLPRWPRR
jgi:protein-S-isoprenylcysteine O-methyltransferase Ste14